MNTAFSTKTIATTGLLTSAIARRVASLESTCSCRMCRSTFSRTTIASSTTMPIASTMPNRVSELIENPNRYMPANVPISETGTASVGISVARRLCRKSHTTRKTSTIASMKVIVTSRIETRTYSLVS